MTISGLRCPSIELAEAPWFCFLRKALLLILALLTTLETLRRFPFVVSLLLHLDFVTSLTAFFKDRAYVSFEELEISCFGRRPTGLGEAEAGVLQECDVEPSGPSPESTTGSLEGLPGECDGLTEDREDLFLDRGMGLGERERSL